MRRNISKRQYLIGLVILLLSPLLVLAVLGAYVVIANSLPQKGQLRTGVDSQVVLPWSESAYSITYNGEAPEKTAEQPLDIVFLIDVSGSMTESLPKMSSAAHEVAKELTADKPGVVLFALIAFDTEAEITTDWTQDPEKLHDGLKQLHSFTGQNDTREAFVVLDKLLKSARDEARKIVVFYTDGVLEACPPCVFAGLPPGCCRGGAMPEAKIVEAAKNLRNNGIEIYSIGLPEEPPSALMVEACGAPSHVYSPANATDLVVNFRSVARDITGAVGGAQVSHRLDGRHFSAPLEGTSWTVDGSGNLNLAIGSLPMTSTNYRHPLVPLHSGVWRVGIDPPRLTFADDEGRPRFVAAEYRPLILVVGWLPLLWGLVPALLWTLYYLGSRPPALVERELVLPNVPRPRPPTLLPALPNVHEERESPVPTLFIGLGGAGRKALHATRAELKQSHLAREGLPYRFLWLDLDARESSRSTRFGDWADYRVEELTAPAEIYRTDRYLPEIGKSPEHLKWFNAQRYFNAPREDLNLADGAKGDRVLARLALFQWIQEKREPVSILSDRCKELSSFASVDGTRQIVVFASADGGVGSSWFLDIGRLLRRITRQQQQQSEVEFIPEVIGILCESPDHAHQENRNAIELETETSVLSGAFPQRLAYAPGSQVLLDQIDTESPYNWIFSTAGVEAQDVAAQCGELGAVLSERHPRSALLEEADALGERKPIAVQVKAVHVLPTRLYEQVQYELFLRLIGPAILLDIEPSAQGGFAPKRVLEDTAIQHLAEWAKNESPGTPFQMILAAASNSALTPGYLRAMKSPLAPGSDWFANACSVSITRRLQGHSDADTKEWRRDWMPGDAVATLRLLAQRLEQVKSQVGIDSTGKAGEVIEGLISYANSTADELQQWILEFCEICEKVSRHHEEQTQIEEELDRLSGRTYIDIPDAREDVERRTQEIFEAWLGTPDTISALRERLFFAVVPVGDSVAVRVRSYVGEAREFQTAREVSDAVGLYVRKLARAVPCVRIGGALSTESVKRREQLARGLVNITSSPRKVLVVTPRPIDKHGLERQTLEEFKEMIPQPANHGEREEQAGDDHAAVRRLELKEVSPDDAHHHEGVPFVAVAEQLGEAVRKRAEKKYGLVVPPFPPELRIALAHPEAFLSFVRAYKAGHIVQQEDSAGTRQWVFSDTSDFLTFGDDSSLAKAAANYVWYVQSPPLIFSQNGAAGDFSTLKNWLQRRNYPDGETLVQIAIDVYED